MWERETNMYIMLAWVSYRLQHVHIDWPFFWTRYFCILFLCQGTILYFDVVLQIKEKECTVFFVHLDFILAEKNIILFAVHVDKFKCFLVNPPPPPPNKNISFACIPKTFPISGSVSGADNMKLAVQSSERRTFFSSYRIVSELPVR